jgi:uncharacterized protein (TIGR03083 family)
MEVAAHVEALAAEGEHMTAAAAVVAPGTAVPSCPEWTVRDLVRHMGGVHRWATGYVAGARSDVWDVDLDDVVGSWPDDAELVEWFRAGHAALVAALADAPADLECWTFLPAPSPRAMWARRQAHETAIHRVDTELAAGVAVHPFSPAFAADGVDELLTCFVPRRSTRLTSDTPATLAVSCTDTDGQWLLRIDGEGVTTEPAHADPSGGRANGGSGAEGDPTCTVRGEAGDLYLALWNRTDPGVLRIEGDDSVLDLFRGTVRVRWA